MFIFPLESKPTVGSSRRETGREGRKDLERKTEMSGSKTFQDPRKTDNYDTLTIGIQKLSPMLICLLHRVLIDPTLSILPSIPKSPKDVYPLLFSSYNPRNCFVKLTVYLWKRTCVYKYKLINIFY